VFRVSLMGVQVFNHICRNCGWNWTAGLAIFISGVFVTLVVLPATALTYTRLMRHSREQHEKHVEFDVECLALPIAFSFLWLCYGAVYNLDSTNVLEAAKDYDDKAFYLLAAAAAVVLVFVPSILAILYGPSTAGNDGDSDSEAGSGTSATTEDYKNMGAWWWQSIFSSYDALFCQIVGYLSGLALFLLCEALVVKLVKNECGAAWILVAFLCTLCPLWFTYRGTHNLAHAMIAERETSLINNTVAQSSVSQSLLPGGKDKEFNCSLRAFWRFLRQSSRHMGSVSMRMCRLMIGWAFEEAVVQLLSPYS
jgi:hypothetical protein